MTEVAVEISGFGQRYLPTRRTTMKTHTQSKEGSGYEHESNQVIYFIPFAAAPAAKGAAFSEAPVARLVECQESAVRRLLQAGSHFLVALPLTTDLEEAAGEEA